MKKYAIYLFTFFMLLTLVPTPLRAETAAVKKEKVESAEAKVLLDRLNVIKAMDKSAMSRSEKKQLRQEVRAAKATLADLGQGVYLSAGAIIIILLILILLL